MKVREARKVLRRLYPKVSQRQGRKIISWMVSADSVRFERIDESELELQLEYLEEYCGLV